MCKFCDSKKEKTLLSYDNSDSMNICYGQYQGVNVMAEVSVKGNLLTLNAHGSYRSSSDCYYEEEGLDCDSEGSIDSPGNYIKIEYCPFCGKKLNSTEFEGKKTEDEIESIKYKLGCAYDKLEKTNLFAWFSFVAKGGSYDRAKELVWDEFTTGKTKLLPVTIETILKEFGNFKVHMLYGVSEDEYYYYPPCPVFNPNEGIRFTGSSFGEFHGHVYTITEEQYDMLAGMGLIKRNDIKLKGIKNKRVKCQEEIDKLKKKLDLLKKELKGYKNAK